MMGGVRGKIMRWAVILLFLLAAVAAGGLWWRVNVQVKRLLAPENTLYSGYGDIPEKVQGVKLTPFDVKGWDGTRLQACIVEGEGESEALTPRQHALLDLLKDTPLPNLAQVDYVLVCVDWDHGIRSALPMAEELAAAGLTCVLWEPRGADSGRPYCTHGLQESKDVAAIIEALEKQKGQKELMIVGIGKGFGAELMLQAIAAEPRLRTIVAIDAVASLNKILKRAHVSTPMRELIGWRMNQLTGLEPFDIAAVKSAALIPREAPVLLVHTGESASTGTLEDSIAIFTQLKCDRRTLLTPRDKKDAPDAEKRSLSYTHEGGTREIIQNIDIDLIDENENVLVDILRWLNASVSAMQEEPVPSAAAIPEK